MLFRVVSQRFQDASSYKGDDVDFLLEEDKWDDFGYHTLYHLHATARLTGDAAKGAVYLGPINIMRVGQKADELFLLRRHGDGEPFCSLPEGFFSMTTSIGLFEALQRLLNARRRMTFIRSMRLILSEDDDYYREVEGEDCFSRSLLRWTDMKGLGLQTGRDLLLDRRTVYNLRQQTLTVRLNGSGQELRFDFSPLRDDGIRELPNGIIAFIGKNGAGKSTALYDIAALMYSNLNERETLGLSIGELEPPDITMSRLLMFSYNPFDNFLLPGELSRTDLLQWARKVNDRSGRFIFCGFRDVEREAQVLLECKREPEGDDGDGIGRGGNVALTDRRLHKIQRKSMSDLAREAHEAYRVIMDEAERRDLWEDMAGRLRERHEEMCETVDGLSMAHHGIGERSWSETFGRLSTGHKFFLHAMTHAFAYVRRNSLFMFDEPENHLQWPLLGFMMQELRLLLSRWSSVMLVATHSPVILQDMLSENIRIVRRAGGRMMFQKPRIETYCESFGEISSEVFDLTADRVFFFDALRRVFDRLECAGCGSAEEAVGRVREFLGDISTQAIHFVAQLWMSSRHDD